MADIAPKYPTEVEMISLLRSLLPRAFPVLRNRGKDMNPWGVSRPVSDPKRGGHFGGMKDGKLVKAKAADVYLNASNPYEKKLGDALFKTFLKYRLSLGISFIVWNGQKSNPDGTIRRYVPPKNTPTWRHEDHLHIEFNPKTGDRDQSDLLLVIIDEIKMAIGEPIQEYPYARP